MAIHSAEKPRETWNSLAVETGSASPILHKHIAKTERKREYREEIGIA